MPLPQIESVLGKARARTITAADCVQFFATSTVTHPNTAVPREAISNTHEAVFRSALVAVVRDGKTHPRLCVELEQGQRPSDRLTRELLALGQAHPHTRRLRQRYPRVAR